MGTFRLSPRISTGSSPLLKEKAPQLAPEASCLTESPHLDVPILLSPLPTPRLLVFQQKPCCPAQDDHTAGHQRLGSWQCRHAAWFGAREVPSPTGNYH